MFLAPYHTENEDGIRVAPEQASQFAKEVAGDFNPLHDADSKRFCVPGDLLFAIVLDKCGLNQRMKFKFTGMVGRDIVLNVPQTEARAFTIAGHRGKSYLEVERDGDATRDPKLIGIMTRDYVAFSGRNFPHILGPLMKQHNAMINVERPLVIYESMMFDLKRLDFVDPVMELAESTFNVNGKRGDVELHFNVIDAHGDNVGHGFKKLVLGGLREYDEVGMQHMTEYYEARKAAFQQNGT